jgi:hypothetical protein
MAKYYRFFHISLMYRIVNLKLNLSMQHSLKVGAVN